MIKKNVYDQEVDILHPIFRYVAKVFALPNADEDVHGDQT